MSFAQLTPEHPHDDPASETSAVGKDDVPADESKRAEAKRLESLELERAADEGMAPPSTDAEEADARMD